MNIIFILLNFCNLTNIPSDSRRIHNFSKSKLALHLPVQILWVHIRICPQGKGKFNLPFTKVKPTFLDGDKAKRNLFFHL